MNLEQLETLYRFDAFDNATPPYVSSDDVARLFTEAEREACQRADLIREVDDPTICKRRIAVNVPTFEIDQRVTRVANAMWLADGDDEPRTLRIVVDRRQLDAIRPQWRTEPMDPRELLIERHHARLACLPTCPGTVTLECFRIPQEALKRERDCPEIDEAHHRHLVHWVLKRAFSRPDGELRNPGGAQAADEAFTQYFGERPDADMKQSREATPEYNVAQW